MNAAALTPEQLLRQERKVTVLGLSANENRPRHSVTAPSQSSRARSRSFPESWTKRSDTQNPTLESSSISRFRLSIELGIEDREAEARAGRGDRRDRAKLQEGRPSELELNSTLKSTTVLDHCNRPL